MFYIRHQMGQDLTIKINIHDENVFTRCPYCSKELSVDLSEVLSNEDSDLFSTAVVCSACAAKVRG